jgi:hypothetical protein
MYYARSTRTKISSWEANVASPDIASGSAGGLLAFMDFMIAKGYGTSSAISPWKSAARQIFSIVEGDDFEELDVRTFDIDEYMGRFENRSIGKYSSDSLRAYRQRFRKAVEAYRAYLADPNWRPVARRAQKPKKANGQAPKRVKRETRDASSDGALGPPPSSPSGALIAYPFPLKNGQMAQLHLPTQGLDREDADRLTHFIRALVFDQPAQLNAGEQPEDA